jgi:hypothetical protein
MYIIAQPAAAPSAAAVVTAVAVSVATEELSHWRARHIISWVLKGVRGQGQASVGDCQYAVLPGLGVPASRATGGGVDGETEKEATHKYTGFPKKKTKKKAHVNYGNGGWVTEFRLNTNTM